MTPPDGPLVSVVIPAYNAERWVGAAVRSVLAQTYANFEVLVVDDGSKDGTAAVAEAFGGAVRCIRQKNGGVSRARNHGAAQARGEFLAFLDADDDWLPAKLETQVRRLRDQPELVASFMDSLVKEERSGSETVRRGRREPDMVAGLLLYSCIVGDSSSVMVRRDAFEKVGGFDPAFSQCADWDMWIRLAEQGPLDIVHEPLARYWVRGGSMSRSIPLLESDTLGVLAKFFSSPDHARRYGALKRRIYGNQYLILSGSYLHAGDLGSSLRCLAQAVGRSPRTLLRAVGTPARAIGRRLGR